MRRRCRHWSRRSTRDWIMNLSSRVVAPLDLVGKALNPTSTKTEDVVTKPDVIDIETFGSISASSSLADTFRRVGVVAIAVDRFRTPVALVGATASRRHVQGETPVLRPGAADRARYRPDPRLVDGSESRSVASGRGRGFSKRLGFPLLEQGDRRQSSWDALERQLRPRTVANEAGDSDVQASTEFEQSRSHLRREIDR